MQIYFACSLTGGRQDEVVYGLLVDHLLATGHDVPTAHLARPEVMEVERVVDPVDVYRRDIAWLSASDALIAEVSTPSHGVGYEIAYALGIGKPVLCLYRADASISKMIMGNTSPNLQLRAYREMQEVPGLIDDFLGKDGSPLRPKNS